MRKKALLPVMAMLLAAGVAQATTNSPATLSITGKVYGNGFGAAQSCSVSLSRSSIDLGSKKSILLPVQGANYSASSSLISVSNSCYRPGINNNAFAYKFMGTADSVEQTVLANTLTSDDAAKGIGVGVYTLKGQPIAINNGTLIGGSNAFYLSMVKLKNTTVTGGKVQSTLTVQVERL
ncbi:fimbrial protein [Atlantibacter subterraneus]|uniref:fimbrial protein n=1 Tax=Atlantibacter subterraneus TaxID=255519 RepID=UPI00289F4E84|nr:fimbrial protein [Atlantibacter subterranea]